MRFHPLGCLGIAATLCAAPRFAATAVAESALPDPVTQAASTVAQNGAGIVWLGWGIGFTVALALALALWFGLAFRRLRRLCRAQRIRLTTAVSSTFENVIELDLDAKIWYEYFILDSVMERTKMPETLDVYRERFLRERIYREDMAAVRALLTEDSLRRIGQSRESVTLDFRKLSPTGDARWCRLHAQAAPVTDRATPPIMLSITDMDQTRQAASAAHKAVAEVLQNADRLSRAKNDFMNRISHEIRTPLNAIMGFLAMARQNIANRDKLVYCLSRTDEASRHMLTLVNDILQISAIEKNNLKLNVQPFQLKEVIGDLASVIFERARQNDQQLNILMEGVEEDSLLGDPWRLHQILYQLADNALKFTSRGGHIQLMVQQTALREDSVYMSFSLADDGIGIAQCDLERIFEPFTQAEDVTTRRYEGAGIGLPLVKNIVETMGGTVRAQSTPGKGSTFTLSIPFGINRTPVEDELWRRALADIKVMLVDHRQTSLEYGSQLFRRLGIPYATAISGDVAIQKAKLAMQTGHPFDLYFVEWDLPGMSAHETIRALYDDIRPQAKIVVISAIDSNANPQDAADLPIEGWLKKPISKSTLIDLLDRVVGPLPLPKADDEYGAVDLKGRRVLLAEDNLLNREIAGELLKQLGLEVDTAENGQQAFERYLQSSPGDYQAVLMDIQMPVMDGYDATRAIRASARPDAASIPIIAITANAFPEDISRSLDSGMNDHLSKPIDLNTIRLSLQKQLC